MDKLLDHTNDEDIRRLPAAYSLGTIDSGNEKAIDTLDKLLATKDEKTRRQAAYYLGKIDPGNEKAIAELLRILEFTDDELMRGTAATSLRETGQGNEMAIAEFGRILDNTNDEDIRRLAAHSLATIDPGNERAIAELLRILKSTKDKSIHRQTAFCLGKIITTDENRKTVITALQPHLKHKINKNNFHFWRNYYKVLWNIAQELPYPDFYRAWPGLTENSTLVQTLELAQLPKNLQTQLTETNLNQTLQLFCIDGSKFIGDDPAKTIYRQMTQQGGHKIADKPKNMADLQEYWADLIDDNDKHPVLIFYEDPTPPTPQGFNPTFLDMLTRFDGIICLITDQSYPGLKTFSPEDPQLIDNIMAWLSE